jgi:hypothetical protein
VQHTDRLPDGSWSKLLDAVARATNRTETATDADASTNRFYRLVTPREQYVATCSVSFGHFV